MQCINLTQYRQSQYRITNRWISHESTSSLFISKNRPISVLKEAKILSTMYQVVFIGQGLGLFSSPLYDL
jgi:hypothetical protein